MLFREESLENQGSRLRGEPVVPSSRIGQIAVVATILFIIAVVAGITRGSYPKKQSTVGQITSEAGLSKLFATRAGVLTRLDISAGDSVLAGQTVAVVTGEQFDSNGLGLESDLLVQIHTQEAMLRGALDRESLLRDENTSRLDQRLRGIGRELTALAGEQDAVDAQYHSAVDMYDRIRALLAEGYVSEFDVAHRREQVLSLQRARSVTLRQREQLENERTDIQARMVELALEADRQTTAIRRQLAELEERRLRLEADKESALVASTDGVVTVVNARPGEQIQPGQFILAIIPDGAELVAELMVPSTAIGFVEPDQEVRLRYSAFPYERYGAYHGTVMEISQNTLRPDEWPTGIPMEQAMYKVRVALDRQDVDVQDGTRPLAVGMLLEADIIQERQPLWQWLFEPLLAMRGRV